VSDKIHRLGRSFRVRAELFVAVLESQIATTSGRQAGVALALGELRDYVRESLDEVSRIVNDVDDYEVEDKEEQLTTNVQLLKDRISAYDSHFSRQSRGITPALDFLLNDAAETWGVKPKSIIATVGEPHNLALSASASHDARIHRDLHPDRECAQRSD
jgi:hypothetical protein